MKTKRDQRTAFEQGQKAGADKQGPFVSNPFDEGSAQHNNFEVGRRFGAQSVEAYPRHTNEIDLLTPDADESSE